MKFLLLFCPLLAFALPQDMQLISGDAALLGNNPNQMELAVSETAILEWGAFSIASHECVQFIQPGASSCVLNRVTGQNPSEIFGSLKSNGECILINPNGVVFGKESRVDVHSLIATTFDLYDLDSRHFEGKGGDVYCYGTIAAKGHVYMLGERVGLFDNAQITVPSGKVLIGGDFQGKNPHIPSAEKVYFSPEACISVDAGEVGDGGTIILWSDTLTQSYGSLFARGGSQGGNGGFIEVSSPQILEFESQVNLLASNGSAGTLLLDPLDLTIAGANAFVTLVTPFTPTGGACAPGPGNATLDVATLSGAWAAGNVIVQTTGTAGGCPGDIIWAEGFPTPVLFSSAFSLTLDSANDIYILSFVDNSPGTGDVTLNAAGAVFVGSATNASVSSITTGGNIDVQCVTGLTVIAGAVGPANSNLNAIGNTLNINVANGNLFLDSITNADNTALSGSPLLVSVPQGAIDILCDTSGTTGIGFNGDSYMTVIARDTITFSSGTAGRNQNGGSSPSGFPSLIESLTGDVLLLNTTGQRLWFISNFPLTFRAARDFIYDVDANDNRFQFGSFPLTIEAGRDITIRYFGMRFSALGLIATAGGDILFEQEGAALFSGFGALGMTWNAGNSFTMLQNSVIFPFAIPSVGPISITSGGPTNFFVNTTRDLIYPSTSSTFSILAGGNINYSSVSSGLVRTHGSMGYTAHSGANINLFDNARVTTDGTDILLIAGINIRMNPTSLIDMVMPLVPGSTVTLVVDDAFPSPPFIGPGAFIMLNGAQIMTVERPPIAIYTAQQSLNFIAGQINGSTFSAGAIFVDTDSERWCVYYPDGFNVVPFRVHYKNCLQLLAAQATLIIDGNLLTYLHPAEEFPGWWKRFTISSQLEDVFFSQPYFITHRQLRIFNSPKSYTHVLHDILD